jgi:hypothetical protein
MDHRARHIEDDIIGTPGEPYQRVVLRGRHNESFRALNLFVEALHSQRSILWNNIAPELRPKANDEVHTSRRGPGFADSGHCGGKILAFLRVQNVKLQIRMSGSPKSKDSSLRRAHAVSISMPS